MSVAEESLDFGYSLGVLHHVSDTEGALRECVKKLKMRAPFLLYLYYALEIKSKTYRVIWRLSDFLRRAISKLPFWIRYPLTQIIAVFVYLPLAKLASLVERLGLNVSNFPLAQYRQKKFYRHKIPSSRDSQIIQLVVLRLKHSW